VKIDSHCMLKNILSKLRHRETTTIYKTLSQLGDHATSDKIKKSSQLQEATPANNELLYQGPSPPTTASTATENKWYQLFAGTLIGFSDLDEKGVQEANDCIPPEWKVANYDPLPEDNDPENSSTWIETILDGLNEVRKFICYFKSAIKMIFLFRFKKNHKHMVLVEHSMKGWISWSKLKEKFKSIGDYTKKQFVDVKQFAVEIWDGLKGFFVNIKRKIFKYIVPEHYQASVKKILDCGGKAQSIMKGIYKVVSGVVSRSLQIARIANGDPSAIVSLIIDLICAWDKFVQGWDFFQKAWKSTDILQKYNYYGRAFGRWFVAVVKKKLKKRRLN